MEAFSKYKTIILASGGLLVLMVIVLALSGGDDTDIESRDTLAAAAAATLPSEAATTTAPPGDSRNNPDVPPVDCGAVLTTEAVEVALNVWDRPEGPADTIGHEKGETCSMEFPEDEKSFVRLEPGEPSDFESGMEFLGSVGKPVADVGDAAIWFSGSSEDAHAGLLAVRQETSHGALHFRITLGRPELDDDARLGVAEDLARSILPRFPGVEVEAELVVFEDEPAGNADGTLSGLLYQGVESGEWSMGDGLVAILDAMANGTKGVVPVELTDSSATGVIAAAHGYLKGDPEDAVQVAALLDQLTLTLEDLEEMSSPAQAVASSPMLVSLVVTAQPEPSNPCDEWAVESPCLEKVSLPDGSGLDLAKYSLYAALNENSVWSIQDVETAKKALVDSAITYEALGSMPPTSLVLRPGGTSLYASYLPGEDCRVYVDEFLAGTDANELQQILAREIGFCLIAGNFFPQFFENPNPTHWLAYGLANYLSGVVYTSNNLEHKNLPQQLAQTELSTTVVERSWTNWILFEHFNAFIGPQGVTEMIRGLPESGDLAAAFAAAPGVEEMYHDLSRGLSDANVDDLGPGTVPYSPPAWELNLSGPAEVPFTVPQLGVRRLHIKVPPGKYACADSFATGDFRVSWRAGAPGDSGDWSDDLPDAFEDEAVLVVTSVKPGAHFTLDVTDVADNPECEDETEEPDAGDCELNVICDPSGFYFEGGPGN